MSIVYIVSDPTPISVFRSKRKAIKEFMLLTGGKGEYSNYNDEYETARRRVTVAGITKCFNEFGYVSYIGKYQNIDISFFEVK